MRYNTGYNREGDYDHFVVSEERPLLEWLIANVPQSKSKVKAVLQGRGIKVNGKTQKLKSGTTYYVQEREIRKVGGINYIGNISIPVAVKVK